MLSDRPSWLSAVGKSAFCFDDVHLKFAHKQKIRQVIGQLVAVAATTGPRRVTLRGAVAPQLLAEHPPLLLLALLQLLQLTDWGVSYCFTCHCCCYGCLQRTAWGGIV